MSLCFSISELGCTFASAVTRQESLSDVSDLEGARAYPRENVGSSSLAGVREFLSLPRKSAYSRGRSGACAINYINRSLYKRTPRPRLQARSFTRTRSLFDAKVLRAFASAKGIGPVLRLSQVPSRDADRAKLCRR